MAKTISAKVLLSKHVSRKDRVLLVNPPVAETRYSWLRWNQPLDLLKIASFLKRDVGCVVSLFDAMQPDAKGAVRAVPLPRDRRYWTVGDQRYPMRHFGQSYSVLQQHLIGLKSGPSRGLPTQVWITSLCSYWYESVVEVCRAVKQFLPDARIVLVGQYPRLMTSHACEFAAADIIVKTTADLSDEQSCLELYGKSKPPFVAVELRPELAAIDIAAAVHKGIYDVALYTDDVCQANGEPLSELIDRTAGLHKHLRYHIICGLKPRSINPKTARCLAHKQISDLYLEEDDQGDELNIDAYADARNYLEDAGRKIPDEGIGGFAWIGRPKETLEGIIQRAFQVLESFGGVILKPFTPTPGGPDHTQHAKYLDHIPHREWSPHFFPFAELNGITRHEYHELYRMSAFLNEKVRGRSFDFLKGTLGAKMLRESLAREVWKLEPHPLRIVD
jgi:hypothetical protein